MKITAYLPLIIVFGLAACGAPERDFGVYKQSDGTFGVLAPAGAKDSESQEMATAECKKLGMHNAVATGSRKTINDLFPMTYTYICR